MGLVEVMVVLVVVVVMVVLVVRPDVPPRTSFLTVM
jgi:hypothetical protein